MLIKSSTGSTRRMTLERTATLLSLPFLHSIRLSSHRTSFTSSTFSSNHVCHRPHPHRRRNRPARQRRLACSPGHAERSRCSRLDAQSRFAKGAGTQEARRRSRQGHALGRRKPQAGSRGHERRLSRYVTHSLCQRPPETDVAIQPAVTLRGVDGGIDEDQQGYNFIEAAQAVRLPYLVYTSVSDATVDCGVPHFETKAMVEIALNGSGLRHAVIAPTGFYDNFPRKSSMASFFGMGLFDAGLHGAPLQMVAVDDIGKPFCSSLPSRPFCTKSLTLNACANRRGSGSDAR